MEGRPEAKKENKREGDKGEEGKEKERKVTGGGNKDGGMLVRKEGQKLLE